MFHVKHSFAEAKSAEQCVQHIFHPRATGKTVESRRGQHESVLRSEPTSLDRGDALQFAGSLRKMRRLTAIECNRILRRHYGACELGYSLEKSFQAVTRKRRHGE